MCGIVYAHDFGGNPVNNGILQQFDLQRRRGTQGFGLFDGQEKHIVRAANEDRILNWLVKYDSNLIMFHHRFPTSTVNVKKAAHPFSTKDYFGKTQYILIHNGVIRNSKELRPEHEKKGIKYQSLLDDGTFNDSESLLWDFALYNEGEQKDMKVYGRMAFVCVKLVKGELDRLYFASNNLTGSPLKLKRDKKGIALSSEGPGDLIDIDTLYTWNYKLKRLTNRRLFIREYDKSWSYGKGSTYTPSAYTKDESDAYQRWLKGRSPSFSQDDEKAGNWLGDHLRKKFAKAIEEDEQRIAALKEKNIIEYEQDPDTQMMLPVGTKTKATLARENKMTDEEIDRQVRASKPTSGEVETLVMTHLASVGGHFEQAYWAMEEDYIKACDRPDTEENIRARVLLEEAIDHLSADPEYTDQTAVSSVWGALWQEQAILQSKR